MPSQSSFRFATVSQPEARRPRSAVRGFIGALAGSLVVPLAVVGQNPATAHLTYSVQVVSAADLDWATTFADRWTTAETPFFVVPIEIEGRPYYRVQAGLFDQREAALTLMGQLVSRGVKEKAAAWDVRPTGFAFLLGSYPSPADRDAALARARSEGIPAYAVMGTTPDGLRHLVYAGGYEGAAQATYLGGVIEGARGSSALVERRGIRPDQAVRLADTGAAADVAGEDPPEVASGQEVDPPPPPVSEVESAPPTADTADSGMQDPEVGLDDRPENADPAGTEAPGQVVPGSDAGGFTLGLAAIGGAALETRTETHLFGGGHIHPQWKWLGVLASAMYGSGGGYESLTGFGALTVRLLTRGPAALYAYGGYGYYQETVFGLDRSTTLPTAGGMVTLEVGMAEVIGAFTGMIGTIDDGGAPIDLEVFRLSAGVGLRLGRR